MIVGVLPSLVPQGATADMVVNYSKWDALELSDDSDVEVHPNVDKRSFIRAKQNQIHMERDKRRHEIKTLKYERIVNDGLLERIDALLESLKGHADQVTGGNPDNFMMQALMDSAGDPDKDSPPPPPEGVHYKEKQPTYSEMMAGLVDQVKKDVGSNAKEKDWYKEYISGVNDHKLKVQDLQKQLLTRLNELETEEAKKITSDSIHDGFNTSTISKDKEKSKETAKPQSKAVEVLNPGSARHSLKRLDSEGQTSGADADVDEPVAKADDDEDVELTAVARKFGQIKIGDYKACLQFISENHEVLEEKNQDGLLMEAFNAGLDGNLPYAKQCVHQALLLQYCRTLGKDGVGMFFKRYVVPSYTPPAPPPPLEVYQNYIARRKTDACPHSITTPNHQAQKVFSDDVNSTFNRIKTRTAELKAERAANADTDAGGGVEQIQLHAVEPGSSININVPQPGSTDAIEIEARRVFETFPPGLQRALESGSLDRVNEVLGKMSVGEAEEVVDKLGEQGMLSMEKGVIDGTTEEGQRKLKELEEEAARAAEKGQGDRSEGHPAEEEEEEEEALKGLNMGTAKPGVVEEIEVADPD